MNILFTSSKSSDGNMSFVYGDQKEVLKSRQRFFKKIGIKTAFEVQQTHSNKIVLVNESFKPNTVADGMITNKSGVYLMVKVADCIPIGLYDPKYQVIGLIHAGRKGLKNNMIQNATNLMQENFHTKPQDLVVKFGPSIGPCCYRINIWQEAENQLINLGVLREHIDNPKICTYHTNDYFSHSRAKDENLSDSRFVTILGLK